MQMRTTKTIRSSRGVTIIELLVVIFIMSLIGTGTYMLQNDMFTFNRSISGQLGIQGEARQALRKFTAELRTASPSSTGAYPIAQAATSSITFYANIDDDPYIERLRYFLATTTFNRGVIKPSGSPLTYDPNSEVVTELVHGIANGTTSIFTYYDQDYDGSSTALPLVSPVAVQLVRLVKMTLFIDLDPVRPPAPATFTTEITPRNL